MTQCCMDWHDANIQKINIDCVWLLIYHNNVGFTSAFCTSKQHHPLFFFTSVHFETMESTRDKDLGDSVYSTLSRDVSGGWTGRWRPKRERMRKLWLLNQEMISSIPFIKGPLWSDRLHFFFIFFLFFPLETNGKGWLQPWFFWSMEQTGMFKKWIIS